MSVCPQCHMTSNHKVQRMNTNHLKIRTITLWIPQTLFPTVYFIGKYILVRDRDTFRLELDYMSIMYTLVKVL